ncbi:hypothetical protein [Streptomyces sp. NPDC031705]|uniref:hypothetical protein n=1 Tax=Streptomyces sp. NPDC031705 TaxID=3155729 RepID=UPI0033DC3571
MPRTVRRTRAAGVGIGAVVLALAAAAPASTAAGPPAAPPLSRPRIVTHLDFAAGQTPENIALEPDGAADLTFAFARQVARVSPKGRTEVLATLPAVGHPSTPVGAAVTTGLVRTGDGTLYVVYVTGTEAENGIWRLTPDGRLSHFAALPPQGFANGLALDEEHGVLYAADSVLGAVWRVTLDGAEVTRWATGPELDRTAFIGANGIKVHRGAVWVSNYDRGTLLRIPVTRDGGAGPAAIRAGGLTTVDDFAFNGPGDTVLAALSGTSELALVRPDGTHAVVMTARDGLSNPTSVAVRGHKVYVPSAAFVTGQDPNLLTARQDERHRGPGTSAQHDPPGRRRPSGHELPGFERPEHHR